MSGSDETPSTKEPEKLLYLDRWLGNVLQGRLWSDGWVTSRFAEIECEDGIIRQFWIYKQEENGYEIIRR